MPAQPCRKIGWETYQLGPQKFPHTSNFRSTPEVRAMHASSKDTHRQPVAIYLVILESSQRSSLHSSSANAWEGVVGVVVWCVHPCTLLHHCALQKKANESIAYSHTVRQPCPRPHYTGRITRNGRSLVDPLLAIVLADR